jgi:hypothetical protein
MAIKSVSPLSAGSALQLSLAPPPGAVSWRVLRRPSPAFSGPDDPAATRVADRSREVDVTDILGLVDGVTYHYRVYYRMAGGAWMPGFDASAGTPAASYRGDDLDVQSVVRDRLELGLNNELAQKRIKPRTNAGRYEVLLAPFALADNMNFPMVTVHLDHEGSAERAIGEVLAPDYQGDGDWTETEGWLSRITLSVVGVCLNANERLGLRRAIGRVIRANLPIFDVLGLMTVDFQQRDHEDTEHYNVPLYFSIGTFTCLAPSYVTADVAAIRAVEVQQVSIGED